MKQKPVVKFAVIRTQMIGGGTSYTVYVPMKAKAWRPLYSGTYATEIHHGDKGPYFEVRDAIATHEYADMDQGWGKYEFGKKLSAKADRLAVRVAKRAFPELKGLRKLPLLWARWNAPDAHIEVPVRITLP